MDLSSILNRGDDDSKDQEADSGLDYIVNPSSQEVADKAYEKLLEDYDEENVDFDDPISVIKAAELQFMSIREDLIERIKEVKIQEEQRVEPPDINTMLYIIEESAGKTGDYTIFGGAESLIYNVAETNNWSSYERDLVLHAQNIAAEKNGLERHSILDTILICPKRKDVIL